MHISDSQSDSDILLLDIREHIRLEYKPLCQERNTLLGTKFFEREKSYIPHLKNRNFAL